METKTTQCHPKPAVNATCLLGEKGCYKNGKCHYIGNCENKVLTNADRIRAMSDEELARKFLSLDVILNEHDSEVITVMYCDDKGACACRNEETEDLCDRESRLACVLRWLQSPKKEGDKCG